MTETREQPAAVAPTPGRFIKQYSIGRNSFMRFEAPDHRVADVRVRAEGRQLHTRRSARVTAMHQLGITVLCPLGCGGQVMPGVAITGCPKGL